MLLYYLFRTSTHQPCFDLCFLPPNFFTSFVVNKQQNEKFYNLERVRWCFSHPYKHFLRIYTMYSSSRLRPTKKATIHFVDGVKNGKKRARFFSRIYPIPDKLTKTQKKHNYRFNDLNIMDVFVMRQSDCLCGGRNRIYVWVRWKKHWGNISFCDST